MNCKNSCCRAVKHMPYQGETSENTFSSLLLGAFPDINQESAGEGHEGDSSGRAYRRPFVAEWLIPAESNACPCLDSEGLCSIYVDRPLSCRQFPLDSHGSPHPFCTFPEGFSVCERPSNTSFTDSLDNLDLLLARLSDRGGEGAVLDFLLEESDTGTPMLYNNYLLCMLLLSGSNIQSEITNALAGQMAVLESYSKKGMRELTFLVPGTDYCITSATDELIVNVTYLFARVEQQELAQRLFERLEGAGVINSGRNCDAALNL